MISRRLKCVFQKRKHPKIQGQSQGNTVSNGGYSQQEGGGGSQHVSEDTHQIVMLFLPRAKDCLLKKGLQKGRYAPEIDLVVD